MVNLRSYRTTVMFLGILVLLTVTVFRNNCKQLHKNLYSRINGPIPTKTLASKDDGYRHLIHTGHDPHVQILFNNMPSWMSINPLTLNSSSCSLHLKSPCIIKTGKRNFEEFRGVIFYCDNLPSTIPVKQTNQSWIFFSIESPYLYQIQSKWKFKFDATMTFRKDSSFPVVYGTITRRTSPRTRDYTKIFRMKTKMVAWAVSHCHTPSKRENYVTSLQKYVTVDIFGKCGHLSCGVRSAGVTDCHFKFAKDYKFYLAFENSICKDYTTEKLFNFFFHDLAMIPVINGPPNAHEYIPRGTYINALDFSSPVELARELHRIGSNETLYVQYLREKDKYGAKHFNWKDALCPLCKTLQTNPPLNNTIPDIDKWLKRCRSF